MIWYTLVAAQGLALLGLPALKNTILRLINFILICILALIIGTWMLASYISTKADCALGNQESCVAYDTWVPQHMDPKDVAAWDAYRGAHPDDGVHNIYNPLTWDLTKRRWYDGEVIIVERTCYAMDYPVDDDFIFPATCSSQRIITGKHAGDIWTQPVEPVEPKPIPPSPPRFIQPSVTPPQVAHPSPNPASIQHFRDQLKDL